MGPLPSGLPNVPLPLLTVRPDAPGAGADWEIAMLVGLMGLFGNSELGLDKTQAISYYPSMNIGKIAAILGKRGGSVTSKAKAAASRRNGKLGGRPRKKNPVRPYRGNR